MTATLDSEGFCEHGVIGGVGCSECPDLIIAALLDRCDQLEQAGNTLAAAIAPLVGPDSDVSHFISAWEIGHSLDGEEQADIVTAALQAWRDVAGEAK